MPRLGVDQNQNFFDIVAMKRLLHISDLHFGRIHPPAVTSLQNFLKSVTPQIDLIVMTGDWTQRARAHQYKEAADFLDQMPCPVVSIPGNHDIPLYNFWKRMLQPLRNYNMFIRDKTLDSYEDSEVSVVGLRTATRFRTVEGRLLSRDITKAQNIFTEADSEKVRVLACHHPLYVPKMKSQIWPPFLANRLLDLKPHIVLSGHSHLNWVECVKDKDGHQIWHISAGSTTSNRLRGEVNSFHILDIDQGAVVVSTYFLGEEGFIVRPDASPQKIQIDYQNTRTNLK